MINHQISEKAENQNDVIYSDNYMFKSRCTV